MDNWTVKLDTYLDGELSGDEMRDLDAHLRGCPSCVADALNRLQLKRAVQVAGKRYSPGAEFRARIRKSVAAKPRWSWARGWVAAAALASVLLAAGAFLIQRQNQERHAALSELADLHVATLASANPVDVISTDRHTVKPWFQGKLPFTFDLPELQNSQFTLLGGRLSYLEETPGAELIYEIRKHRISVFIFEDRAVSGLDSGDWSKKELSFNVESWSQGGLRYFVVGDAGAGDIRTLADLLKAAGRG